MDKPADLGSLLWSLVSCKQVQLSFLKQRGYLISRWETISAGEEGVIDFAAWFIKYLNIQHW